VQNKNLDEPAMRQLLLDTVAAGRSGSVDMPELASHASAITKTSSSYAGSQLENQRKLLGLAQVGVRVGSVSEAATMLSNISGDASKHNADVTALLGQGTFNAKGQIAKGPDEFIADVLAKTGGNRTKIQALGFGQRSLKMFDALLPTYNDAESAALKGGSSKAEATAAARKAVMADTGQFTGATMTEASLNRDFSAVMQSSAERFESVTRELSTVVGEKLLPELVQLIPLIGDLVPELKRFLDGMIAVARWALDHPFAGVAAAAGLAITSELTKAAIGETIKRFLTGGGSAGGGAGGGAGVLGGAALAITAGVVTIAVAKPVVDGVLEGQEAGQRKAGELTAGLKNGSRADREAALAQYMAAQDRSGGAAGAATVIGGMLRLVPETFYSAVTGEKNTAVGDIKQTVNDQEVLGNEDLRLLVEATRAGTAATRENTAAMKHNPPGSDGTGSNPVTDPKRDTNIVKRN
jgi:hypothetical protein